MTAKTTLRPLADARAWTQSHALATRWLLAGPVAILFAVATMMAMPLWFPSGAAGINDVAMPILLTPLLWAVPFLYACLAEDLFRCAAILVGGTLAQAALVAVALAT